MKTYVIVKTHELALKGNNRPWFMRRLVNNLRVATKGTGVERVWQGHLMVGLTLSDEDAWPEVRDRVQDCFGVAKFFKSYTAPPDLDEVKAVLSGLLEGRSFNSFRITANRADKRFPVKSDQINRDMGAYVKDLTGARVDLTHPDLNIHLDVQSKEILIYFDEIKGYGGLPVGVSGLVTAMLSGGIDSPVAAWQLMKRGCTVTFVHFHSYPILSRASQEKARELVTLLTEWQQRSRLFLVAFGDIQQQVVLAVPGPMRVIVYRRLMMRIAERIGRSRAAQALVTGDVVGQVASQTLENLAVVGSVATLPVFRPLIGMDKEEITAEAIRLGTYPISIIPDQDCCTLFTPRNPQTKARLAHIEAAETALPIDALVDRAVAEAMVEDFEYPVVGSRTEVQSGVTNRH